MKKFLNRINKHKKIIVVLLIITALVLLHRNLYNIALLSSNLRETHLLDTFSHQTQSPWIGRHSVERYRVIFSAQNGGKFAMLRGNFLGIWHVSTKSDHRGHDGSVAYMWSTGIPGTESYIINHVYHNPATFLNENIKSGITNYTWFQINEGMSTNRVSVRILQCENISYVFHFTAQNPEAFAALGNIYDMITITRHTIENLIYAMNQTSEEYTEEEPPVPTSTTVVINNYPTLFETYEINSEIFFAICEISNALSRTQAWFDFHPTHNPQFDFHTINNKIYATLENILTMPHHPPELTQTRDALILINTNEPHIDAHYIQLIAEFMYNTYPELFLRYETWEGFEESSGFILDTTPVSFSFSDFYDGIPAITIRFNAPGTMGPNIVYILVDGEYRRAGFLPVFRDTQNRLLRWCWYSWCEDEQRWLYEHLTFENGEIQATLITEEVELVPGRFLNALSYEITDIVNQKFWQTRTLPGGTIVDINICDEVVNLVQDFFNDMVTQTEWINSLRIEEIMQSLIFDNLVRVKLRSNFEHGIFDDYYWMEISDISGEWKIYNYVWGFFWHDELMDLQTADNPALKQP